MAESQNNDGSTGEQEYIPAPEYKHEDRSSESEEATTMDRFFFWLLDWCKNNEATIDRFMDLVFRLTIVGTIIISIMALALISVLFFHPAI
ncbi:MAG: hypothetical protein ISN28_09840 [Ectothiorhodospiraceae bacterium AqS1]|nr:hypothetical protein [Ectothiorhodospiraceae bacterium AqS1]